MGIMGNTLRFCPGTNSISNLICNCALNFLTGADRTYKTFIGFITQKLTRFLQVKYIFSKYCGDLGCSSAFLRFISDRSTKICKCIET